MICWIYHKVVERKFIWQRDSAKTENAKWTTKRQTFKDNTKGTFSDFLPDSVKAADNAIVCGQGLRMVSR